MTERFETGGVPVAIMKEEGRTVSERVREPTTTEELRMWLKASFAET